MPKLNRSEKFEGSLLVKTSPAPRARTKSILSAYVKWDAKKGGFVLRAKNGNSLLEGRAFAKTEDLNAVLNPLGRHFKADGGIRFANFAQN
jgi:hypothetical protein